MRRLSAREKKILDLLILGFPTDTIARDLATTARAVKADMREILRKLTAHSDDGGAPRPRPNL